jgi:hypothetical protein
MRVLIVAGTNAEVLTVARRAHREKASRAIFLPTGESVSG